ncbi:hypothetical protein E4U42_003644 [Claviceps africana]|uniref:Secreted protein n=1 Tax=Claviceps africana TaxID=83212 RepID=A0A8K0NLE7_9HYPO|nr:hypothetical protein E4U42_003644 [Claviceps africana]
MHVSSTTVLAVLAVCAGQTFAKCSFIKAPPPGLKPETCAPSPRDGTLACHRARITGASHGYWLRTTAEAVVVKASCAGSNNPGVVVQCDEHSSIPFVWSCEKAGDTLFQFFV